jgi:D-aminopeptidase
MGEDSPTGLSRRQMLKASAAGAATASAAGLPLAVPAAARKRKPVTGRKRARELGIVVGQLPTGPHNNITDVPGVKVGYATIVRDRPRVARTGVTVILPRSGPFVWDNRCFAGMHSQNGNGEFTGFHWLEESGLLASEIAITNTHQVGIVRDSLIKIQSELNPNLSWDLPVVGETYDGGLNDINAFHVKEKHVRQARQSATSGKIAEGNVGGGTGMSYYGFKGGSGSSSRVVTVAGKPYTVGVFVQSNFGSRPLLRVNGAPVGREIPTSVVASVGRRGRATQAAEAAESKSCIIVVATDAPLVGDQCKRLARRAGVGLARTGDAVGNGSGNIFMAFATGNDLGRGPTEPYSIKAFSDGQCGSLFAATAEATEEALLNSATMAETTVGFRTTRNAIPLDRLVEILDKYNALNG